MVLPILRILGKIGLPDYIRHMSLNNLETVLLQVTLDVVVCPRMEIQQIFSHNQYLGALPATVIGNLLQIFNRLGKSLLGPRNPAALQALAQNVHPLLKSLIGAALLKLVGPDFPQKPFQGVNHRQGKGNPHGGYQVHLEARMNLVRILIIVGQNGDVGKARIIQGFAQQLAVMGQAAVSHIFSHSDGHMIQIVAPAL